jgi:hypothetical protein
VAIGFAVEGNRFSVLPWVQPTPDGGALVVTHSMRVEVLDAARGTVRHEVALEKNVADVDLVPGQDRVLITEWHRWNGDSPMTRIQSLDLGTGRVIRFEVPNCSSELVLTPDAHHAFLSPSNCRKDPVSLIDLDENLWLRNLPGFGPVAGGPRRHARGRFPRRHRRRAPALRRPVADPVDRERPLPPHAHRHRDARLPHRAAGRLAAALRHHPRRPHPARRLARRGVSDGRLRLLDVLAARMVPLTGTEDVRLENYVVTTDATRVFLLYHGLYRVDVGDARLVPVPLAFAPLNLNITPRRPQAAAARGRRHHVDLRHRGRPPRRQHRHRTRGYRADTVTGVPFRTAVPSTGSTRWSSVSALTFTLLQPCGSETTPGIMASVASSLEVTSPTRLVTRTS